MKKRNESFWGIHCDYHVRPWMAQMNPIGKTLCEEDVRTICRELRPDFWQIDCKGHFGYASYPNSKLENSVEPFALDTLALFRKVTREENVALYIHYSGLWDELYCSKNPTHAVLHADGTYDQNIVFPKSPYVDELLIPQICEVYERYGIDGVWIDGDNWASCIDYREETLSGFEKEYRVDLKGEKPQKEGDPYFQEYREYNREIYRNYVRRYVDILHEKCPGLQICSNWLFSDLMPEEVSINVDYISGDTAPFNSLNATRYAVRYLPQQNISWDVMGMAQRYNGDGKFDLLPCHTTQVIHQAAATISLGGGFQAGLSQLFDGSLRMTALKNLIPVADFVKEREPFCFGGKVIPQAAMFVSAFDRHLEDPSLFTRGKDNSDSKRGLCSLLCTAGQSLQLVSEHTLCARADEFPLIVLPETVKALSNDTVSLLLEYAKRGGSLLLTGKNTCRIFADAGAPFDALELDDKVPTEKFLGQMHEAKDERFFTIDGSVYGGVVYPIQVVGKGKFEVVSETCYDEKSERRPYAIICEYGKGKIAAIAADIGFAYDKAAQFLHRDLAKLICNKLYTPKARVERALGIVDIVCLEKNGRLMLQLLNGNGNHGNVLCDTEDFIPPSLDICVSVECERAPKAIKLQPEGKELPFEYKNGRVYVEIDRLYMHNILEFEE